MLGLNYDVTPHEQGSKLAPEEYEIRRRIVWAAFSEFMSLSVYSISLTISIRQDHITLPRKAGVL
jgi:hypothetical protein